MFPRSVVVSGIALGVLSVALIGHAQQRQGADVQAPPEAASAPNESGSNGPPPDAPEKKVVTPAAGYAYADKSRAASRGGVPRARYRKAGPVVNMPGFEPTADGGSRLFVQLSQSVPVEERKAPDSIVYVLKGASPRVWNNTNALVTVHFNTPVSQARLVPKGKDLLFIVDLRAAATPTWKMNAAEDKSATFIVDFPKGDYLPSGAEPAPADGEAEVPRARPKGKASKRGSVTPAPPASTPAGAAKP